MNLLSQPVRCRSGVTSVSAVLSLVLILCGYPAAGCGSAGMPPARRIAGASVPNLVPRNVNTLYRTVRC